MKMKLLFCAALLGVAVVGNGQWLSTVHLDNMNTWSSQAGFIEWYNHTNNTPNGLNYGNGVQLLLGHDPRLGAQIVIPTFEQNIYFRRNQAGTWDNWAKVWHSGNLNRSDADFTARNLYISGNVGVGTSFPQAIFHAKSGSIQTSSTSQYDANMIIEASDVSRSTDKGAALGFVVPANTDGSNPWQQGRILVAADNTSSYNACGRMYIQTRSFDSNAGAWKWNNNLVLNSSGNVLIGKTTQTNTTYKLDVAGKVRADEITVNTTGADFVFDNNYKLRTLAEVEAFIKANKHLPDVAPAADMQTNGVNMGDMQAKLLQKVEELTLYTIEQEKQLQLQRQSNAALFSKVTEQEKVKVEQSKQLQRQEQVNAVLQQQLALQAKEIEELKLLLTQKLK